MHHDMNTIIQSAADSGIFSYYNQEYGLVMVQLERDSGEIDEYPVESMRELNDLLGG